MTFLLPRRSFLAGLAGALFAPAIVRAGSLMPLRGMAVLAPLTQSLEDTMMYQYWVAMGNDVRKMSAREIIDSPPGLVKPWLGTSQGLFRPIIEDRKGLVFAQHPDGSVFTRNFADALAGDPVLTRLRDENKKLVDELRRAKA